MLAEVIIAHSVAAHYDLQQQNIQNCALISNLATACL
jgi:hypothetical protein